MAENLFEQKVNCLFSSGDYYGAWNLISAEAESGNADALCVLGDLYYHGVLVEKDEVEAAIQYRKAADANSPRGNYEYAVMYENGEGLLQASEDMAVRYYLKSAELGYDLASFEMGRRYDNGEGVPINERKAFEMYHRAAESGNVNAQVVVGLSYIGGSGTQINYSEAIEWLRKAAYQRDTDAMVLLGELLAALKPDYDYEPSKEMYKEALLWLNRAAEQGQNDANFCLAIMYADGLGVEQNGNTAYQHLKIAADGGNEAAANLMKRFRRNIYGEYYFS